VSYEGGGCASKIFGVCVSHQFRVDSLSTVGSTNNNYTVDLPEGQTGHNPEDYHIKLREALS